MKINFGDEKNEGAQSLWIGEIVWGVEKRRRRRECHGNDEEEIVRDLHQLMGKRAYESHYITWIYRQKSDNACIRDTKKANRMTIDNKNKGRHSTTSKTKGAKTVSETQTNRKT